MTDPLGIPFLRCHNLLNVFAPCGEGEAAVCDKLHDYFDYVHVWLQTQKFAGEPAVPYCIIGCCEFNKHSTCLLFHQKALFNLLSQQSDLIYG